MDGEIYSDAYAWSRHVATFADRGALDAYTVHPEHIKVVEFGSTISAQVASVDFES